MQARLGLYLGQSGQSDESDRLYADAIAVMRDGGRERSESAWAMRNEWAIALNTAGDARAAWPLVQDNLRIVSEDAGGTPQWVYNLRNAGVLALRAGAPRRGVCADRAGSRGPHGRRAAVRRKSTVRWSAIARWWPPGAGSSRWPPRPCSALTVSSAAPVPARPSTTSAAVSRGPNTTSHVRRRPRRPRPWAGCSPDPPPSPRGSSRSPGCFRPARSWPWVIRRRRWPRPSARWCWRGPCRGARPHSWRTGVALLAVASARSAAGRHDEARTGFAQAVDQLAATVDDTNVWLQEARRRAAGAPG